MHDVTAEKAALRQKMHALRGALPPEVRQEASEALIGLADLPEFRAFLPPPGGVIAGFVPIKSEINPLPLMRRLAEEGFALALPRITPEGLVFHAYIFGEALAPGQLGTREPFADRALAAPALILAAMLAFDRSGARIGYGKAYYDRAFAAFPDARRVGLAFSAQEVEAIPREGHDAVLEAVFTEKSVI